jgi:hypothetical protein
MKAIAERVYQFKISLIGTEPPIWRRIQVPETYTFWDLHVAIQDAMGWKDSHLHEFRVKDPSLGLTEVIGIPVEEADKDWKVHPGWERKIADYFPAVGDTAEYLYDPGDNWWHTLVLEEIAPRQEGQRYPQCQEGKRACPPEDCGGIEGFHDFLEAALVVGHQDRSETLTWVGGKFDVNKFDPRAVVFDDPQKRWKAAFSEK